MVAASPHLLIVLLEQAHVCLWPPKTTLLSSCTAAQLQHLAAGAHGPAFQPLLAPSPAWAEMLSWDTGADAGSTVRTGTTGTQSLTAPSDTTQGCLFVKPFPSDAKLLRDSPGI